MSTQKRPLIVGLVSPGLIWLATSVAQGQGTPGPRGLPTNSAPASPSTFSVLLMSNGTVVKGEIVDDPAGGVYRLKTRGGQVPYPKTSVKRAGHSIDELYRYQVAALPPGDPDERMKLVRWCLTEHLTDLARQQLDDVLKLSPEDSEAVRMAANLDANSANQDKDPELKQTSAEMPKSDAPASLDPGIVKQFRKGFGNTLPEIFDLPAALAVRRASEFAEYVQPILQKNCASCHNDRYQGDFQLVEVKNRKDYRNPDVARANLDAALRLVNPDDPSRSDLLSAGLVPHGPNKGAIFRGANDRQYQVIATWVRSIRPNTPVAGGGRSSQFGSEGVTQAGYVPPEATDGFASDKTGRPASAVSTGKANDQLPAYIPPGATRTVNEYNESADFSGGKAKDFPVFSIGGKDFDSPAPAPARTRRATQPATLPPLPGSKPKASRPVAKEAPEPEVDAEPEVAPTTAVPVAPGRVAVEMTDDLSELPGMNQPKYPSSAKPKPEPDAEPDDEAPAPVKSKPTTPAAVSKSAPAKKKAQVDPALLEKLMKARNAGTP